MLIAPEFLVGFFLLQRRLTRTMVHLVECLLIRGPNGSTNNANSAIFFPVRLDHRSLLCFLASH